MNLRPNVFKRKLLLSSVLSAKMPSPKSWGLFSKTFKHKALATSLLSILTASPVLAQPISYWRGDTATTNQFGDAAAWSNGLGGIHEQDKSLVPSGSLINDLVINSTLNGAYNPIIDPFANPTTDTQTYYFQKLYVGEAATSPGTLTITNGGRINLAALYLGVPSSSPEPTPPSGGTGPSTLTLSNGSTIEFTGYTSAGSTVNSVIGKTSNGTMNILSGSQFTQVPWVSSPPGTAPTSPNAGSVYLAENAGPTGIINVDGPGSLFQLQQNLYTGYGGSGLLNISNNGAVDLAGASSKLYVAHNAGSTGAVNVTSGGTLKAGAIYLANTDSTTGSLTVQGQNATGQASTLNVTGEILVGDGGSGTLNLQNHGQLSAGNVSIAHQIDVGNKATGTNSNVFASGSGDVHIGGQSTATVANITLGNGTRTIGNLTVDGAAQVVANQLFLGTQNTSKNTALITDSNTKVTLNNLLQIRSPEADGFAQNTLLVSNGAQLELGNGINPFTFAIGNTDPDKSFGADGLKAALNTPKDFAIVNIDNAKVIGKQASSAVIAVGLNSKGQVNIINGGELSFATGNVLVGGYYPATLATLAYQGEGEINISGTGSKLTIASGNLTLGSAFEGSKGTLKVSNGGSATISGTVSAGTFANDAPTPLGTLGYINVDHGTLTVGTNAMLGLAANSEGQLTVDASTVSIDGALLMGTGVQTSQGSATISNSSVVTINGSGGVGIRVGQTGTGSLTISSNSILNVMAGGLVVGNVSGVIAGQGVIEANTGAKLNIIGGITIANTSDTLSGQTGIVRISDAGTELTTTSMRVGGPGVLVVNRQALVQLQSLSLGGVVSDTAAVYLHDQGNLTSTQSLFIGGSSNNLGQGTLYIGQTEAGVAAVAGTLNTPLISFGNNTSALTMTYTDSSWTLASVLESYNADPSAGIINQNTAGTTFLTGNSTGYLGTTNINQGTISIGNGSTSGNLSGTINIASSSSLDFNRSDSFNFAGVLAGNGQLKQVGTGVTTLSSANTGFTGTGSVVAGTLKAGTNNSLGANTVSYSVASGATLDTSTYMTNLAAVTNDGTVVVGGAQAQLNLTGAYTQTATGSLNVVVGAPIAQPALVANDVALNGGLSVMGFQAKDTSNVMSASQLNSLGQVLIQSNNAITGSFIPSSVSVQGPLSVATVDYLVDGQVRLSSDQKQVILSSLSLAWTEGTQSSANGSFTLAGGTSFNVDVALNNRLDSPFASTWDGQSLTKKGAGTLILSADNGYTGLTEIKGGVLSIASGSNVGSGAIYLGNSTSDVAASLVFQASSGGPAVTTSGLNGGNTTSLINDIFLANRADNTISVIDAAATVTLTGSLSSSLPSTTTALTKTGAGTLIVAPSAGKTINYTGDMIAQEGALTFSGDGSLFTFNGNFYAPSTLTFDVTSNTLTLTGDVYNTAPVTAMNAQARALSGPVNKTGTGTLLVKGNSYTDWNVTDGILATTSNTFNSNVTLAAGTTLSFVNDGATVIPTATYTGTLTGAPSSTLEMNRTGGQLYLNYNSSSTIGSVLVSAGYLAFQQTDAQPTPASTTVNRFAISGDLTVAGGATAALLGSETYLNVGGTTNLQDNSILEVALDASRPLAGDILTTNLAIGNNVTMNMVGFAVPLGYDPNQDVDLSKVFKASDLPGYEYLLIDSLNTKTGVFANPIAGDTINNPSYILYELQYRDDSNGNAVTAPNSEVWLGNFRLAWLEGGSQYGNGTFNMDAGTALNIDVPLPNMTGPFDSGWDGSSLTKTGQGLLILSNPDNSYTGTTTIDEGTLLTGADDVLDNSSKVIVNPNGNLNVYNTTQHVNQLDNTGNIDLRENGQIILANKDSNGNIVDSHLGGTITGGNRLHDGETNSTIRVENGGLTVDGNVDVDHLIFAPNTKVEINQGGSLTGQTDGGDATITVNNGGTWTLTDNSTVGSVNLNGGLIDFGNPLQNLGDAGRTLTVDNWTGNGGTVNLYGENNNGMPKTDQIIINGQASGNTELRLIDTGGLAELASDGALITLVQPGPNGQIQDDAFHGTFITGFEELAIGLDSNGRVVINPSSLTPEAKVTSLGRQYLALVGGLTQGQTASAVTSLGNFSNALDNTEAGSCSLRQAFGTVNVANGKTSQASSLSTNDYRQYSLLAGSDVYGTEFANGCLRVGSMLGYNDSRNDIDLNGVSLGQNSIDSKQIGAYVRYSDANNWYATAALMHYWDDIRVSSRQDQERNLDSTAWALSLEVGKKQVLGAQWSITPSAQVIYQRTNLDDVKTGQQITQFDSVGSSFVRLGAKANYQATPTAKVAVNADLWHQLASSQTIHAKALTTGQRLNSLGEKESHTWGDVGIGIESINKNLMFFGKLGYQGDFSNTNAITGRVGIRYSW